MKRLESFRVIYEACRSDTYPAEGCGQSPFMAFRSAFGLVVMDGWPGYLPIAFWRKRNRAKRKRQKELSAAFKVLESTDTE